MHLKSILAGALLAPVLAFAQPYYVTRQLPQTAPNGDRVNYIAVNNLGQALALDAGHGPNSISYAYLVGVDGSFHLLASGKQLRPYGLNDAGVAIGDGENALGQTVAVFMSEATSPTPQILPSLPSSSPNSDGIAINNNGQATGDSDVGADGVADAALWTLAGSTIEDLGSNGNYATGMSINDSGVVAGYIQDGNTGALSPVEFNGPGYMLLPEPLGNSGGQANGINSAGVMAGYTHDATNNYATVFTLLSAQDLPGLPLVPSVSRNDDAFGIADDGTVLGESENAAPDSRLHGWVYKGGVTYDLANVVDQQSLAPFNPVSISSGGVILAASSAIGGYYVLTPQAGLGAHPFYVTRPLPQTAPDGDRVSYVAVNNLGQALAYDRGHGKDSPSSAYLVDVDGTFHLLATGMDVRPYGLNDAGAAIGQADDPDGNTVAALMTEAESPNPQLLPLLPSIYPNSDGFAINNAGQATGDSDSGPLAVDAVIWALAGPTLEDLGSNGNYATGLSINNSGVVAGYIQDPSTGAYSPVEFNGPGYIPLPYPPGNFGGRANSINDSGVIAGYSHDATNNYATIFTLLSAQTLPGVLLMPSAISRNDDGIGIANDGTVLGQTLGAAPDSQLHGWIYKGGVTYDLVNAVDQPILAPFQPVSITSGGVILAASSSQGGYYVLTPQTQGGGLTVTVTQRVDGGSVPDGTVVKLLNNSGTALSPPTSATTVGGVATFSSPPNPSGGNSSYEVEVCVPTGGKGVPAVLHSVSLGSTTVYYTAVKGDVVQSLTSTPPVALATCRIDGVSVATGTNGMTPAVWLPDGTYSGCSLSMSPGRPCTFTLTLGASSSSNLVAYSGYAGFLAHMTRVYMTARNANGTSFIPKAGTWSISPGALSGPVNGQVISPSFWLPNGAYAGSLSGAASNGSSPFQVGTLTANGQRPVLVSPGP